MKLTTQRLKQLIKEEIQAALDISQDSEKIIESREGDYQPQLDHVNMEKAVAVFALKQAEGKVTTAAQLCYAAHEILSGKRHFPEYQDEAIADLMRAAGLSEAKVKTKKG